jgi:hypothetical protein
MQNFKEMAFDVFIDGCFIICHKKLALHWLHNLEV